MGITKAKIAISSLQNGRKIDLELIADTGSILTWVDEKLLENLGIERKIKNREFTLMSGHATRDTGVVLCEIEDRTGVCEVVFAKEGDANVIGVTALESLGFEVDPLKQKLKKGSLLAL